MQGHHMAVERFKRHFVEKDVPAILGDEIAFADGEYKGRVCFNGYAFYDSTVYQLDLVEQGLAISEVQQQSSLCFNAGGPLNSEYIAFSSYSSAIFAAEVLQV